MRILIIEDEKYLAMVLSEMLIQEGYYTDNAYNGEDGLDNALSGIYDVIILDVMLPKLNGLEVLCQMRRNKVRTAVLMLTAKSEIEDKVAGLDMGADDYITKPFDSKELLARVRALSRRKDLEFVDDLQFADITIDKSTHEMHCGNNHVRLSKKEYDIMEMMILGNGRLLSKDQIITKIWGYDTELEYNSIEVYISFLRKKLAAVRSCAAIVTSRGLGYALEVRKNGE